MRVHMCVCVICVVQGRQIHICTQNAVHVWSQDNTSAQLVNYVILSTIYQVPLYMTVCCYVLLMLELSVG